MRRTNSKGKKYNILALYRKDYRDSVVEIEKIATFHNLIVYKKTVYSLSTYNFPVEIALKVDFEDIIEGYELIKE